MGIPHAPEKVLNPHVKLSTPLQKPLTHKLFLLFSEGGWHEFSKKLGGSMLNIVSFDPYRVCIDYRKVIILNLKNYFVSDRKSVV